MKHIIITGTARSGKTTLAKMLKEQLLMYNEFHGDCIREWIIRSYGQKRAKEITHAQNYPESMAQLTDAFLSSLAYPCIVEWSRFFPCNEHLFTEKHKCIFVYLGHGGLSGEKLYEQIRRHESANDFTLKLSEQELLASCERWSETDKRFLIECKLHNRDYYNTSNDRLFILSEIMQKVINETKE